MQAKYFGQMGSAAMMNAQNKGTVEGKNELNAAKVEYNGLLKQIADVNRTSPEAKYTPEGKQQLALLNQQLAMARAKIQKLGGIEGMPDTGKLSPEDMALVSKYS